MALLVNRAGLADALGISVQTVDAHVRRGMPAAFRGSRGKQWSFEVAACVGWLLEQKGKEGLGDTTGLDLDEARRRKMAAEAALAEYDLAEKRGDVIQIDLSAKMVTEVFTSVRTRFLAIPSKLAPIMAAITTPEEARDILDGAINEALSELASTDDLEPHDDRDGARCDLGTSEKAAPGTRRSAAPAPEAHRRRVGRPRKEAQPGGERGAGAVVHPTS
jgi:phage terminase Nu1 subunit (DNA packaging protein)